MSKQIKTSEKIANSVFGYCVCLDMMRLAADNLGDMAKESFAVRVILKIINRIILFSMRGKSKDDPSVKIVVSAIAENPLESLISITNGIFTEKRMSRIVRMANR